MSDTIRLQTCPLCEAACGLQITMRDGVPFRVRGDKDDPQSRGYLCPKGASLIGLHDDPDRLRTPLVRRDGRLQPATWDEAFAAVQMRITAFYAVNAREAMATYTGNPVSHNIALLMYLPQLIRAVGSKRHFSAASVDVLPKQLTCALMYGNSYSLPVPDVDRTHYALLIGANPLVSNGSMVTAPNFAARLSGIQNRGGKVVVIDPRRTKTADAADEHVPIRPGTDVWVLAAIVHTLFAEGLVRLGRLAGDIAGVEALRLATVPFTPALAEQRSGVQVSTVVRLARELAAAPSAVVYGRIGTCLQEHGTMASWLIEAVNVLTGNLDQPGGSVFTSPVTERLRHRSWVRSQERDHGRFTSRVRGLPETFGELPVAALAEEILTPGEGRIRGLITCAGNPALSIPGSREVQPALADLDLLICVDNYLNETTRHADVVFPGESHLAREHFPFIARWSVRRYARWTPAMGKGEVRPAEWEVMLRLAAMVSGGTQPIDVVAADDALFRRRVIRETGDPGSSIHRRDPEEILAMAEVGTGPRRVIDLLLRTGLDGDGFGDRPGLTLASLEDTPHGRDFGPTGELVPGLLTTASEKVELAPIILLEHLAAVAAETPAVEPADLPLRLIGRRNLRSNNSWMHNVAALARGREQCTLIMHPSDAEVVGVVNGDAVTVRSATAAVEAQVEVSDTIAVGVVCLPHGFGHQQTGVRLGVASAVQRPNSNELGSSQLLDRVTGNAVGSGIPVAVARR